MSNDKNFLNKKRNLKTIYIYEESLNMPFSKVKKLEDSDKFEKKKI